MGIFLRQSYNVKPPRWGSPADIEYAIKVNAEKIYDVDPDSIVLAMPLFWGLPCLDYSGKRNDGVNHGAYYKNGELEFDGVGAYIDCGKDSSLDMALGNMTFSVWIQIPSEVDNYGDLVGKGGWNNDYTYGIVNNNDHIMGYLAVNGASDRIASAGYEYTPDTKNHYVLFFDRDTSMILYINGNYYTSVNIASYSAISFINAYNVFVGKYPSWYVKSLIYDVRISNVVQTADQIALFHALPYGLYQPVIRPVYHFITSIPVFMHHFKQMRNA